MPGCVVYSVATSSMVRVLSCAAKESIEEESKAHGLHGRLAWTHHQLVRRAYRGIDDCVERERALMVRMVQLGRDMEAAQSWNAGELVQLSCFFPST